MQKTKRDAMVGVMGGMDKATARQIIGRIKRKGQKKHTCQSGGAPCPKCFAERRLTQ